MSANDSLTLTQIQDAFASMTSIPYCSGSVPLDPAGSTVFYSKDGKAEVINFLNPTEAQLVSLAEACQPATFGRNNEDVLDESYRKAGKMDTSEFATQFSPPTNGMIGTVKSNLLRGELIEGAGKAIRVELYKLNVYGPGSFFKTHVDTPRGEDMFGSLVVVFPTVHEGGSLILRHGGEQTIFDTAQAVNGSDTPHAAFVAFYSDVEHEVALVKSGYRVTLTYNLYLTDSTTEMRASGQNLDTNTTEKVEQLKSLLTNLFKDPNFLPEGGFLGFGLSHQYPFSQSSYTDLERIGKNLKGGDAEVKHVCDALGLNVRVKAVYMDSGKSEERTSCCLLDFFFTFNEYEVEDQLVRYIFKQSYGQNPLIVYPPDMEFDYEEWVPKKGRHIVWLRPTVKTNSFDNSYLHYGNEATMSTAYGNVCLVAEVGKAADRVSQ